MQRILPPLRSALGLVVVASALSCLLGGAVHAQVVLVPSTPQIGSSNPITAEPPVTRPHSTPCVVQLFQNLAFADFTPKVFSYTPPATCPGPWAKVVFTADFTVTAGRQFDRTAAFYLGHASIYYGTTAEPRHTLSPSWHVERDVTDLSAIFKAMQTGEANIGNFVGVSGGVTYDGIIYADAALEFYPGKGDDSPSVPDIIVPVNGGGGDAGTLNTTSDQITQTLNLPTNVERVYLDVIAQSQSTDEFWYFNVPNDQTAHLESFGNTSFRETEVTIDGQPAGVAPVYPWIYTGGIDPYLWEPIPGVQTLDFKPYRVDLTPFAGLLSDGNAHTVGVSVFNAENYFLATANLLVFTDHGSNHVSGGIISNSLSAAPSPTVNENISFDATTSTYTGTVTVASNRRFAIRGYVNTSHGRVETSVEQNVDFLSAQEFDVNASTDDQSAQQMTTVDSHVVTHGRGAVSNVDRHFSYPLNVAFSFVVNPDGSFYQTTTADQQDLVQEAASGSGGSNHSSLSNEVKATDTLKWDTSGNFLGPSGASTTQTYRSRDSRGNCYSRTISAAAQALTTVTNGQGCDD
jgi:Peptide N-acetyl-beta-D-glucosaminyl asparaginase amidase A